MNKLMILLFFIGYMPVLGQDMLSEINTSIGNTLRLEKDYVVNKTNTFVYLLNINSEDSTQVDTLWQENLSFHQIHNTNLSEKFIALISQVGESVVLSVYSFSNQKWSYHSSYSFKGVAKYMEFQFLTDTIIQVDGSGILGPFSTIYIFKENGQIDTYKREGTFLNPVQAHEKRIKMRQERTLKRKNKNK